MKVIVQYMYNVVIEVHKLHVDCNRITNYFSYHSKLQNTQIIQLLII